MFRGSFFQGLQVEGDERLEGGSGPVAGGEEVMTLVVKNVEGGCVPTDVIVSSSLCGLSLTGTRVLSFVYCID